MTVKPFHVCIRGRQLGLALAGLLALVPFLGAQQAPEYGCRMAPSCRPSGFSFLNKERGVGPQPGPALGLRWESGFEVFIPGRENFTVFPKPASNAADHTLHLGSSLAPPSPMPTLPLLTLPRLTPTPLPSDRPER
jgi:hypothetical protein